MKKVVVGLSGGVDSSVAAYLLKEQGYQVIGLFMRNWNDPSVTLEQGCLWEEDTADAMLVAEKLDIPFQVVDLSEQYRDRIVNYMFREYEQGQTPNPDILCNREIKFDEFLSIALKLGADYVATGHYCRKKEINTRQEKIYRLISGADSRKDQSYFLCQLNQFQLSKALFPIGHLQKEEVRKTASSLGLVTANKKDSQGLCFIGRVRLPDFLQQKLKAKQGNIIEIPTDSPLYEKSCVSFEKKEDQLNYQSKKIHYRPSDGKIVGRHNGAHYFTIGQRKGLAVGGTSEPLFVIDTDVKENIIYVGQGHKHRGLWRKALHITNTYAHWVRPDLMIKNGTSLRVKTRIRYRQPLQESYLYKFANGYYILFDSLQEAIAKGQFAACYIDQELIFSGVIN